MVKHPLQAPLGGELLKLGQPIIPGRLEGDQLKREVKPAGADQLDQRVQARRHDTRLITADLHPILTASLRQPNLTESGAHPRFAEQYSALDSVVTHTAIIPPLARLTVRVTDLLRLVPIRMLRNEHVQIDERTVELIAAQVIAALREDLETILAEFAQPAALAERLTVEQVADRLGVARSTVYAHWREWGGYKLGPGDKAPIRFDGNNLPAAHETSRSDVLQRLDIPSTSRRKRRRRRDLVSDSPRLAQPLDGLV